MAWILISASLMAFPFSCFFYKLPHICQSYPRELWGLSGTGRCVVLEAAVLRHASDIQPIPEATTHTKDQSAIFVQVFMETEESLLMYILYIDIQYISVCELIILLIYILAATGTINNLEQWLKPVATFRKPAYDVWKTGMSD